MIHLVFMLVFGSEVIFADITDTYKTVEECKADAQNVLVALDVNYMELKAAKYGCFTPEEYRKVSKAIADATNDQRNQPI